MLEDLITQLPNFAGMVVCIGVLIKMNGELNSENRRLLDVIVKKENCSNAPEPPVADRAGSGEMPGTSILPEVDGRDK